VLARLIETGKYVLVPFANVGRYEQLIDESEHFVRVECKTSRYSKGCLRFHTASCGGYGDRPAKAYDEDADVFGVWSPVTDKVYFVPVKKASKEYMSLRIDKPNPRSNQAQINWAKDYEI
jgi:hypothetical protein